MPTRIYWFIAVFGYIIQTKCLSQLQTRNKNDQHENTDDHNHHGLTLLLTFMYFSSWLFLAPISRLFKKAQHKKKSYLPLALSLTSTSSSSTSDLELQTFSDSQDTSAVTRNNNSDRRSGDNDTKNSSRFTLKYLAKLITLSLLVLLPVVSYVMALSMSPGFDVALIQNTSIFEITSLLYGVCGFTKRKSVFRNFTVMMVALFGILIVSYTKATCDLLAGKLSINEKTGELNDPFLFDRLKSSLLCGLGALTLGPFAILWNRWFNNSKYITISQQCSHLSIVGVISMIFLLPFSPSLINAITFFCKDRTFWLTALAATMLGTLSNVVSLLQINRKTPPEYSTTINLGTIIFMGISDWICEPTQTTIVRWEVIGYIMLSICCIMLSVLYFDKKRAVIR